ncbi:ComEC/Rec2 family competence protein [Roseivirga sp. BDSF3-8]|uniref:ComEC/Rec2 family competence protein n=1 Tax=Roseivirga sp. BDSF3-8 TaxID=3241598 RepID=UPI0035325492
MNAWSRFPFLRISLFFALGILLAEYYSVFRFDTAIWMAGIFAALSIFFFAIDRLRVVASALLLFSLIAFGYVRYQSSDIRREHLAAEHIRSSDHYLLVTAEREVVKGRYFRSEAHIVSAGSKGGWKSLSEKVLLYRAIAEDSTIHEAGTTVIVHGAPGTIPPAVHPAYFDYADYLRHQQIRYRFFVRQENYLITHSTDFSVQIQMAQLRARMVNRLVSRIESAEVRGVLAALVLGHRNELDRHTRDAYAAAGAMHVLAVSGLHVGILYGVLLAGMSFLLRFPYGRYIRLALILLFLVSYALLTGLSPSVTRAVIMFALLAVGQTLHRRAYVYNSLAVAAFISLMIDPHWLFAPGFQLSYLAVTGIVYLHPRIYRLWEPSTRIIDKIWSLCAVTLAAQVATLPLTWYYFGQFPIYFLFSNLLLIPLATLSLISGLLSLILSDIPLASQLLKPLSEGLIKSLNDLTALFQSLPAAQLSLPYLSVGDVVLMFLVFFTLTALLRTRHFRYIWQSSLLISAFILSITFRYYQHAGREVLVWYPAKEGVFVEAVKGYGSQKVTGTADSDLLAFQVEPMHRYFTTSASDTSLAKGTFATAWKWQGQKYLLLRGDYRKFNPVQALPLDVLAIDKLYKGRDSDGWAELNSRFRFREIILTNYVNEKDKKRLSDLADSLGVKVTFLKDSGLLIQ